MTLRTFTIYAIYAAAGTLLGVVLSVCGGVDGDTLAKAPMGGCPPRQAVGGAGSIPARTQAIYTALTLLWAAESSNGKQMVGDGGQAIGHFQHHKDAWEYGCQQLGVDWPYSDADNLSRAAAVVAACWSGQARQALEGGDVEMLIRQHRLPNDPMRPSNDAYVERVMNGHNY